MAWGSTARPLNRGFGRDAGPHLLGELFVLATGIDVTRVPYRSGADAVPDMLGGRVQVIFGTIESGLSQLVREGKLRAPVVTGETRSPNLPDVRFRNFAECARSSAAGKLNLDSRDARCVAPTRWLRVGSCIGWGVTPPSGAATLAASGLSLQPARLIPHTRYRQR